MKVLIMERPLAGGSVPDSGNPVARIPLCFIKSAGSAPWRPGPVRAAQAIPPPRPGRAPSVNYTPILDIVPPKAVCLKRSR